MRDIRLNLWQRLGIVISVLWIAGAAGFEYLHYRKQYDLEFAAFIKREGEMCREIHNVDHIGCYIRGLTSEFDPSGFHLRRDFWSNAFVPIVLGWLAAYPLIFVARWVFAGRKRSN